MIFVKILKNPIYYFNYFVKRLFPYQILINKVEFRVKYRPFWRDVNSEKWEPQAFKIIDKFLDADHSVIDVGAWIGPITLYSAFKAKKCYSIEPDRVAFKELKKNLRLNKQLNKKIDLSQFCISDKNGELKFGSKSKFGDSMSSVLFGNFKKSITVIGTTLLKFIQDKKIDDCNFIKIDIEGGEVLVLPSIKDFLINKKPTLYLSLHPSIIQGLDCWGPVIDSLSFYEYVYDIYGQPLDFEGLINQYMLRGINLEIIVTNQKWGNDV